MLNTEYYKLNQIPEIKKTADFMIAEKINGENLPLNLNPNDSFMNMETQNPQRIIEIKKFKEKMCAPLKADVGPNMLCDNVKYECPLIRESRLNHLSRSFRTQENKNVQVERGKSISIESETRVLARQEY